MTWRSLYTPSSVQLLFRSSFMSTSTHTNRTKSTTKSAKRRAHAKSSNPCSCISTSFEVAIAKADEKDRRRTGPKPWLERKFTVAVVIALFAWSSYVFWGIILLRCWKRRADALVGFPAGVVLSIFYGLFAVMSVVTYTKIIFTGPGFAMDFVTKSDPPLASDPPPDPLGSALSEPAAAPASRPVPAIVYPPSHNAAGSEYRPSIEERLTHESASLQEDDMEDEGNSQTIGVPYEAMSVRPNGHTRSGSTTAIPPTPHTIREQTEPHSPTTPTSPNGISQPKPAVLRKDSKRTSANSIPTPTQSQPKPSFSSSRVSAETRPTESIKTQKSKPLKITRGNSLSSHQSNSPPASPGLSSFPSTTTKRPPPIKTGTSGYRFESSSYIFEPPRLSSQTHSRTNSKSGVKTPNVPTTMPTPSASAMPTPGLAPSARHPNFDVSGRTEPFGEDEIARPQPYLDDLPPILSRWSRRPSDMPILDPYYRYCSRDMIIKPMRAHHCRICNTCVLGYDHHCPWIGGCVGAQNRKFFVVFLFWCTLYLLYTIGLLIAAIVQKATGTHIPSNAPATFDSIGIDGNFLALIIISGLLCLFSSGMLFTHVHLLRRNASTVEWHGIQNMRERERAVLSQAIPVCQCLGMGSHENGGLLGRKDDSPWRSGAGDAVKELGLPAGFKGRKALRERWDEEWGRIGKEGNLWWLGSGRANWEAVMGHNPWTWFLPIGDTSRAGLDYPLNPRFDERGRWMRRRDWPLELR